MPITFLFTLFLLAPAWAQSDGLATRSRAASQAMSDGRFDEAAQIYRELLQTLPDEAGLQMNLGMALAMGGHEAEALGPLKRAVALKADLLPAHLFLGTSYLALGQPSKAIGPLERVVKLRPAEVEHRRTLARAYAESGRPVDAATHLRRVTEIAPKHAGGWFALGHAYNEITQHAIGTFDDAPAEAAWRDLLLADALLADGRFTDAFAIYRATLEHLPSMVEIHDSIARIYQRTGHHDWAAVERTRGAIPAAACEKRKALCEFRAGRYRSVLVESLAKGSPESRYWRARAATELALAAFKRLDELPDSRERREVRATLASSQRRYVDAIAELQAALAFVPGDPALLHDLGAAYHAAREYAHAISTLRPLIEANPDDAALLTIYGDALLQLQRPDEALPILKRAVVRDPAAATSALTLARAYVQTGEFAAAIPLIEPRLGEDQDGSLHVQLARAYTALGQREKGTALLEKSQELQRASQARSAATGQRVITAPK